MAIEGEKNTNLSVGYSYTSDIFIRNLYPVTQDFNFKRKVMHCDVYVSDAKVIKKIEIVYLTYDNGHNICLKKGGSFSIRLYF